MRDCLAPTPTVQDTPTLQSIRMDYDNPTVRMRLVLISIDYDSPTIQMPHSTDSHRLRYLYGKMPLLHNRYRRARNDRRGIGG